jgi:hypothetical protein
VTDQPPAPPPQDPNAGGAPPPPPPPGGYGAPPPPGAYGAPPPPPPPGGYGAPPPAPGYAAAPGYVGGSANVNPLGPERIDVPGKGVVELATIWQRLIGLVLDGLILGIPIGIIYGVLVAGAVNNSECVTVQTETGISVSCTGGGLFTGAFVLFALVVVVVYFLYFVGLLATRGQTVGGMIMKIRSVRTADGGLPGWGPAFKKWFLPWVVGIIPCVGGLVSLAIYFSPLWDNNKRMQGYQDKWADLYVVKDAPQFR